MTGTTSLSPFYTDVVEIPIGFQDVNEREQNKHMKAQAVKQDDEDEVEEEVLEKQEEEKASVGGTAPNDLPSTDNSVGPGPPPNGGLLAWLQVVGSFFCMFNSFGILNAFGAFQAYYVRGILKGESDSAISWIGAIQGSIIVATGLFSGRLIDAGYGRPMVWVGTFLVTFGYMMASLAKSYYQIMLAQGICIGIGCNFLYMVAVAVISQYFTTKRSTAIGIASSGSSLGGVIYPIMVEHLLEDVGYPWTARILGFTVLGTSLIACILMKPRLPPRKSGLLVDIPSLTDIPYIIFSVGQLFGQMGIFVPLFYVPSWTISLGHSQAIGLYMSSVINAASIFGRTLPNVLADRIGPLNTFVACAFAVVIITFSWISVKSLGGIIVFCLFFGFFSGSYVSLSPSCVVHMTSDMSIIGTRIGMCFFVSSFGGLASGPVAGSLVSRDHGSYVYAMVFAGVSVSISVTCFITSRILLKGISLKKC